MNLVKNFNTAGFYFIAMLLGCLALLAGSGCGKRPDVLANAESKRYVALGEIMADKLNKLTGGKGSVVLVMAEADNNAATAFGQTVAAFRKTLAATIQVKATETVATPAASLPGVEPFPENKFSALLQKYADTDYLVSFVGVPTLTPAQIAQLPSLRPQTVAVVVFNPPTKAMFASKVVCMAAVPKPGAESPTGDSSPELFDACYQFATPETAESLPR